MGYGDRYPVTPVGRFAAAGLMLSGIAVLGVVTASIASWLVENVSKEAAAKTAEAIEEAVEAMDDPLEDQIRSLTEQVAKLTAAVESRNRRQIRPTES